MSLRAKVVKLLEVLLRVPPLFVIDEILKIGLTSYYDTLPDDGLSYFSENTEKTIDGQFMNNSSYVVFDQKVSKYLLLPVIKLLIGTVGCLSALFVFILNTKQLMIVYLYLTSVGLILASYFTNLRTVKALINMEQEPNESVETLHYLYNFDFKQLLADRPEWIYQLMQNCILQGFFGFIFINIHLGPRYETLQELLPVSFLIPSVLSIFPISKTFLSYSPIVSVLLPLAVIKFTLCSSFMSIFKSLHAGYLKAKTYITMFGFSFLVENEWLRLNVPEVLRTFWVLRTIEHAGIFMLTGYWDISDGYSPYFRLLKYLLVSGCDTLTAVLGLTSVVSFICNYVGKFFQWILLTEDENDKNFGTVSAIVFYILALQTGLTDLEPDVRFVRLCRNFCLLFTALLHFTHNIVNPLLMSLSASHNPSIRRHIHALIVCAVLVLLSSSLMYLLWTTQDTSTWLLAVTAFSIEVIVKVFVSLAIYCLFLYDARRESFWEKLDDYIYYIRSFGNTIEFCFGIFLFLNGAFILLYESGSAIRAVMMCIHAYFNIWCDAKAGWSVFMKRRTAVNKIDSLPEADSEQLRNLDDVCAICYQEMQTAKITKCRHFFHGVCLRKWLYVQDCCPLCHEILHPHDERNQNNAQIQQPHEFPLPDDINNDAVDDDDDGEFNEDDR